MKIVAGQFGGRVLAGPKTARTRPVTEMIRGAIFNILGGRVVGADVLDLFAGSGALGLEALSRGAASCVFVDRTRAATSAMKTNLAALDLVDQATINQQDAAAFLQTNQQPFDVVFLDPPYAQFTIEMLELAAPHLKPDGVMVVSSSKKTALPATISSLHLVQTKKYGDSQISFYAK